MNHKGNNDVEFAFMWSQKPPHIYSHYSQKFKDMFSRVVLWYLGLKKCHSWGWCDTGYINRDCVFSPTIACKMVPLHEKSDEASKVRVISWRALAVTNGVKLFSKRVTGINEEAGAQNMNGQFTSMFEQLSGGFHVWKRWLRLCSDLWGGKELPS